MGGINTRNMWSSLQKYNKLYIVSSCWTLIDNQNILFSERNSKQISTENILNIADAHAC